MFGESPLPFSVVDGTPTVSFVGKDGEKLLPWNAFDEGDLNGGGTQIVLKFQKWNVRIEGTGLDLLWESLRQQEVATIGTSADAEENARCRITEVVVRLVMGEE